MTQYSKIAANELREMEYEIDDIGEDEDNYDESDFEEMTEDKKVSI